jgi:hypothetical protein
MAHVAHVALRWLTPEEGGRKQPFVGARYATTARFPGESDLFSVVCLFPDATLPNPARADLVLLFPDLVDIQRRILPGSHLEITEGPKVVARCQVTSLETPDNAFRPLSSCTGQPTTP